jgi:hypothetical protein
MAVYFASAGAYIKIGYSAKPEQRIGTVTVNGKRPADVRRGAAVDLLGWVPGDREREAQTHRRFAADHVAGEWFYLEPSTVRDLIWSDPRGVDIRRMSAWAVYAAMKHPELTRDELAAAGVPILARAS